jgi:hypothetical protein
MQTPAPPSADTAAAARELHQQARTWLALSLLSSLFCVSLCLGIGGAVFCYLAMQAAEQGLNADADAKLKWGKILTLVGSVMGLISSILALIFRR